MTVGGGGVEAGGHPAVARPISITPAARTGIAPSATTAPDDGGGIAKRAANRLLTSTAQRSSAR